MTEMPSDLPSDMTSEMVSDTGALRGERRRSVHLTMRGRDGGRGHLVVTAEYGIAASIDGEYARLDGTTSEISLVKAGDLFMDRNDGRVAETLEALLPLAVRDAPWDVA